jgi:hypothetical protein
MWGCLGPDRPSGRRALTRRRGGGAARGRVPQGRPTPGIPSRGAEARRNSAPRSDTGCCPAPAGADREPATRLPGRARAHPRRTPTTPAFLPGSRSLIDSRRSAGVSSGRTRGRGGRRAGCFPVPRIVRRHAQTACRQTALLRSVMSGTSRWRGCAPAHNPGNSGTPQCHSTRPSGSAVFLRQGWSST